MMACNEKKEDSPGLTLFVGTYTTGESEGIYSLEFNTSTGELSAPKLIAKLPNPSFLAQSEDGQRLYAVQETDDFDALGGGVSALGWKDGNWELLNSRGTQGAHPCHLSLSGEGHLAVANYSGGNVALFALEGDGSLKGDPQILDHKGLDSTRTSHAHMARFGEDGLYVADLGLDALMRYQDREGDFEPGPQPFFPVAAGAGPRHFDFGEKGRFLYVINELDSSISVFERDAQGRYAQVQVVGTVDPSHQGTNSCADIHLSPDGRFLYGSNRGENTLVIFAVDPESGTLELVGRESTAGDWPRNFSMDPSGNFLLVANQRSGNIVVFKRDLSLGTLEQLGQTELPDPVCLLFSKGTTPH